MTFTSEAIIRSGNNPYVYYYRIKYNGETCYVSADKYQSHTIKEQPTVTLNEPTVSNGKVTIKGTVGGPSWMNFKTAKIGSKSVNKGAFNVTLPETYKAGTYTVSANASYTYKYVNANQKEITETATATKSLKFTVPEVAPTPTPTPTSGDVSAGEYLKQCTITPTYLYITATTNNRNSVMTLPCSSETNSNSKQVNALSKGEK